MIRYQDSQKNFITEAQITTLASYYKIYFEENLKRKIEYFENGKLIQTSYFLDERPENFLDLCSSDKSYFYIQKNYDGFKYIECVEYFHAQISRIEIRIYDADNNLICLQNRDKYSQKAILGSTKKAFYRNNEEIYQFDYNEDGSPFMIYSNEFQGDFLASAIGKEVDFSWEGLEYYQNAAILLPNQT